MTVKQRRLVHHEVDRGPTNLTITHVTQGSVVLMLLVLISTKAISDKSEMTPREICLK